MRLRSIHLQHFRNIGLAHLAFDGPYHFFCAPNGQGKTNLLEAMHFVTALRSFRTNDSRALIQQGNKDAKLRFIIDHEDEGVCEVLIHLSSRKKQVELNGRLITRLSDIIGLFPTVVLSADDILLLRGAPALRRRFLDMALVSVDYSYLMALKNYHKAMAERNACLRQGADGALLAAYECMMADAAITLVGKRASAMEALGHLLKSFYVSMVSIEDPGTQLIYRPDFAEKNAQEWAHFWQSQRERDRLMGATQRGPHRDDFCFSFKSFPAKEYASEGQQRGLVLALRLAQSAYLQKMRGTLPIILADDILGQLDEPTRRRFWSLLGPLQQVFATGTQVPNNPHLWELWDVKKGSFATIYQKS